MNRIRIKRALALTMALIMVFALAACTASPKSAQNQTNTATDGKLFTEPTEISIMIGSSPTWPYNENWKMWKYFQEATGATFKITTMPQSEVPTKVALLMASKSDLPDMLHLFEKKIVDQNAASGAFISLSDNLDKLPNYKAFWDKFTEAQRKEIMAQRTSGDGKVYSAPVDGTQTVNQLRTWMYRKDIFDKYGLKPPTTFEEIYQVAKKLKQIYPNSYPLCLRTGFSNFDVMGPSWSKDFSINAYYNFDEKNWHFGATEPVFKTMVEYFVKMYKEGLVPPDYLTIPTKNWEELMSTDRGFMTLDYIVRIDFYNKPAREEGNKAFTLATMTPPTPDVPTASKKLKKTNVDPYGYTIVNTGKQKNIDNAFKLLDWMYTDKGSDLLSWGKEGETYKIVDGQRQFILSDATSTPMSQYGVGTFGLYQRIAVEANEAIYTKEQVAECRKAVLNVEDHANPSSWIPLSEEESVRADELGPEIDTYVQENVSKFLLGQQPMSKWDSFQAGLKEMGVDEFVKIYETAYNRLMSETK